MALQQLDAMDDRSYDEADDDSDESNNEQTSHCVPDERGEIKIKNYRWPKSSSVEFETWRRLMLDNISSAQRNGISDHIINNSLEQYLLTQDNLINEYARLKRSISTATLRGTKRLIKNLNINASIYGPEERFRRVCLRRGESATTYLGRLIRIFWDLFGSTAVGENRRIKQQFLTQFQTLEPEDKKICQAYSNLTEMAIFAEEQLSKKITQLPNMNSYVRENVNSDRSKESDDSKYRPIDIMDLTLSDIQNQRILPPPSPHLPARPILPPKSPGFGNQKRSPLISAGPYADRVSLGEYESGIASDGCFFCNRCLIKGHTSLDCPFFTACAKCADPPAEMGHSTKYHKRYWQRMHQQGGHHAPCAKTCPGPLQNHPIVPSSHAVYQQTDGQSNL